MTRRITAPAALVLACFGACRPAASQSAAGPTAITLLALEGGAFIMGTTSIEGQQGGPPHRVTIAPFKLAETDITFDQYDAFARATSRALPQDEGRGRGDRPVINVSWAEMQDYIAWLNARTGHHYRLPSEAEWEYAARGGTTTAYYWGDELDPKMANYAASKIEGPSPVKAFPPNPFGLYDMSGNVWQVVADCVHPTYDGAPADGSAWVGADCYARVVRGGSYGDIRFGITVAARGGIGETFRSMSVGFRLAEDQPRAK